MDIIYLVITAYFFLDRYTATDLALSSLESKKLWQFTFLSLLQCTSV